MSRDYFEDEDFGEKNPNHRRRKNVKCACVSCGARVDKEGSLCKDCKEEKWR